MTEKISYEIQRMLDDEEKDRHTREGQERYERTVIVSRHQGAIDFVNSKGFYGRTVEQFSPEMVAPGMLVIGILPVHLISDVLQKGGKFIQIQLPEVPREMRGQELTPEQMVQYGAKLVEVEQLMLKEV